MNEPTKAFLHCSATPDSGDLIGVNQIREWHLRRGWKDVGYHYLIRRSGVLEKGRADNVQGAHTLGHNRNSLGVCLIGTKDFTQQQIITLTTLMKELYEKYQITDEDWYCHYQFANKRCPNIPVEVVRHIVARAIW